MPVAISSTSKNEDVVPEPESYPYLWDKESSDTPLKDFLAKVSVSTLKRLYNLTNCSLGIVQAFNGPGRWY